MKHWHLILGLLAISSLPQITLAATLSLGSSATQLQVGQSVTATVRVNADGTPINAAEAIVSFPSDLLKLTTVSKAGTIFKFWTVEPSGSNSSARVTFSGGLPSPGYAGSAGTIIKITWQALAVGTASIKVSGGKILANDGLGTNVLTGQSGATYTISAATTSPSSPTKPTGPVIPTISSTDFSSEQQWYAASQAAIQWTRPSGIEGVSYEVTKEPGTTPDDVVETATSSTTVTLPTDGVWFFHLRAKYGTGWSATGHFRLQRDTTPPDAFDIQVSRDRGLADPSPVLTFIATDAISGVAAYTIAINGKPSIPATSPYTMVADQAGEYHVVVTATDEAGNARESDTTFSVEGYAAPIITGITTPIILLQTLSVHGTSQAGDRVNIFIDGENIGSAYAGAPNLAVTDGTTVRLPWSFTSKKSFSPGTHRLTVTATSADGQTSIASDPATFLVRGRTIEIRGRAIATFAAVPIVGVLISLFFSIIAFVMTKLWMVTRRLEQRESIVDQELKELKSAISKRRLSEPTLEEAISLIDDDLTGRRRTPKRQPRRRTKKNT